MNLEAKDISVSYGGLCVLDGATHAFREGKITVILGPNGCGKTTLIKMIVKVYAKSGELSYIPQEISGEVGLTVRDVVAMGRYDKTRFFVKESDEDKTRIEDALTLMELKEKQWQLYDTLSGGEKQRAMAARVICQDAPWLIMDEPSSNLDIVHSKHILDTVKRLVREKNKSSIIVMHDINDAVLYGDEFVFMRGGKIIEVSGCVTSELLERTYGTKFDSVVTSSGKTLFYAV